MGICPEEISSRQGGLYLVAGSQDQDAKIKSKVKSQKVKVFSRKSGKIKNEK